MSPTENMTLQFINFYRTAKQFFDRDEILVKLNPYEDNEYCDIIKKRAKVKKGNEFLQEENLPPDKFKYDAYDTDEENIIFCDCDMLLFFNPKILFNKEFDVAGRKPAFVHKPMFDENKWFNTLDSTHKVLPMDAAVLAFQNYTHMKIKDSFLDYYHKYKRGEMTYPVPFESDWYLGEMLAFTQAIKNYDILYLSALHHKYSWQGKWIPLSSDANTYFFHVGTRDRKRKAYNLNLKQRVSKNIRKKYNLITDIRNR